MSKAISARRRGDDFQAYYFWKRACGMLLPTSKIEKVGFEVRKYGAFDDVAVLYVCPRLCNAGVPVRGDFVQVKYSVDYCKAITLDALMDPAFINADSISLLQRLRDAVAKMKQDRTDHRFVLAAPWPISHRDTLARLCTREDGGLDLDRLFDGTGPRGKMGGIRRRIADHLRLTDDDAALRSILERL